MTAAQGPRTPGLSGLSRFTERDAPREPAEQPRVGATAFPAPLDPEVAASLERFLTPRERPAEGEVCEMCGTAVPEDDHRHVVDLRARSLMCTCRGCALLFLEVGAAQGHYLTVPERYLRVEPLVLEDSMWASLQIPVGVVFVVAGAGEDDGPVAFYPSPGGATESELPMAAWDTIVAANPVLGEVQRDVEAVLLRSADPRGPAGATEEPTAFVVPVDRCYELVGTLRLHWRGFDGGTEAREAMAAFFAEIERRSKTVDGDGLRTASKAVSGAAP